MFRKKISTPGAMEHRRRRRPQRAKRARTVSVSEVWNSARKKNLAQRKNRILQFYQRKQFYKQEIRD